MKNLNGSTRNKVKISSGFLDDPRLSWDAKGMLSYLLANKKVDFDVSDLLKRSTNGRDSTF